MSEVADFGMFTDPGNAAVQAIVEGAISNDLSWDEVYDCLVSLSNHDGFAKATDTVVREMVYSVIFEESYYYDGRPDEAQEWHDFDPDC
jgi:hypothetical protein